MQDGLALQACSSPLPLRLCCRNSAQEVISSLTDTGRASMSIVRFRNTFSPVGGLSDCGGSTLLYHLWDVVLTELSKAKADSADCIR